MNTLLLFGLAAALAFGQEAARPKIVGISHVALFTADVEKSRGFYKGFLGFEEPYDLKNPDGSLSLTFIKVNEHHYVEIFPERAPNTDRLNHISLETDDIEAMRAYLAGKGVPVPAKASKGRIGNMSFNVKDPDGNTLEFVEYMEGGATLREKGKFLGARRISSEMQHLGVLVGGLEASLKFYVEVLGLKESWRGSRDGKTLSWVHVQVPGGSDSIELMLYETLPEPARRGTAHHLCLYVPDIEKAKAELESRAASAGYTRPLEIRTGINRRRQLNLYDPDGTRVELMEPHTVDGKPAVSSNAPPPR
jgi:lactoylglutathione lyase